jgi:excisionase family DNA binding protein
MTIRLTVAVRKRFFRTVDSMGRVPYADLMERISVEIEKPWLTVADICEYMDVSTFVVTSVLRTGELRAVKFGREWRIAKVDFEDWINSQRSAEVSPVSEDEPLRQ